MFQEKWVLAHVRVGAKATLEESPALADFVEKVDNRTAPKISQKLLLSRLDRCNAPSDTKVGGCFCVK
jgi:hypothetical protein